MCQPLASPLSTTRYWSPDSAKRAGFGKEPLGVVQRATEALGRRFQADQLLCPLNRIDQSPEGVTKCVAFLLQVGYQLSLVRLRSILMSTSRSNWSLSMTAFSLNPCSPALRLNDGGQGPGAGAQRRYDAEQHEVAHSGDIGTVVDLERLLLAFDDSKGTER